MEREVKELSDHVKKLEQSLAESRKENNNNSTVTDKQDSKVCVILWLFALHIFMYKYLFFKYLNFYEIHLAQVIFAQSSNHLFLVYTVF